jgi:choline transport protein
MLSFINDSANVANVDVIRYRWSALYAPFAPKFWSFLQGWITLAAWIATFTQVAFLEGGVVEGIAIQLNPTWIPQQYQGTLIAWAVIVLPLLCNIFARKILVQLELAAGVANILFFFIIVIVLGAMAPRSPASFVFATTFTGISGWKSAGIQWCIGLLAAAFPLQGFDGVIHMSAEIKDPARRVPQAMVLAVVLNGLFSFCFVIALLFTITDVQKAAASPTFYPIIEGMSIGQSNKIESKLTRSQCST